jgi:hypothetical protein
MSKGQLIQVTGLPRSGTAFMSTFLSLHPECISFHELISKTDNYRDEINSSLNKYKFVVDSSTYGYLPQCSYKNSRKVYIERDMSESLKSCEIALKTIIDKHIYKSFKKNVEDWKTKNEVLTVNYKYLFDSNVLKTIWEYCFQSDEYFSEEKANNFIDMNIQMNKPEMILKEQIQNRINKQLNLDLCQ